MGTRNLLCVIVDGEYKVAKYGQWDGYPSGQGKDNLVFLSKMTEADFIKLREEVSKCYFVGDERVDEVNQILDQKQKDLSYEDFREWFGKNLQAFNRSFSQYEMLNLLLEGKGREQYNSLDFAADSLFCEWAYVVDLDKMAFEVYKGFNFEPLDETERFNFFSSEKYTKDYRGKQYYPAKCKAIFPLSSLPSVEQFLSICEPK